MKKPSEDILIRFSALNPWKKRKTQGKYYLPKTMSTSIIIVLVICLFWYGFTWRTQHILETFLKGNELYDFMEANRQPSHIIYPDKYIIVTPLRGQGLGNQLNGLLAAHILADEFGRVLCVRHEGWKDFFQAMDYVNPQIQSLCENLSHMHKTVASHENTISLVNFRGVANECELRQKLASKSKVLFFTGNTYPRWSAVPPKYWLRHYRPTKALLDLLPWKDPPHTVVHLRHGDNADDNRAGLDNTTLLALGNSLPSDTFLVTNWVEWFEFFKKNYGWRNANWISVRHSALPGLKWSSRHSETEHQKVNPTLRERQRAEQSLQMWSDWYTMIMAKKVLHTHSDFSLSAIHWMGTESKTIRGVLSNNSLLLVDECWRLDDRKNGITPTLSQRTKEQLRNCDHAKDTTPRKTRLKLFNARRHNKILKGHVAAFDKVGRGLAVNGAINEGAQ